MHGNPLNHPDSDENLGQSLTDRNMAKTGTSWKTTYHIRVGSLSEQLFATVTIVMMEIERLHDLEKNNMGMHLRETAGQTIDVEFWISSMSRYWSAISPWATRICSSLTRTEPFVVFFQNGANL
ncbi:MAG: hypothetical protein ACOCUO_01910 [archaeon]